jgi:hypothetical protein
MNHKKPLRNRRPARSKLGLFLLACGAILLVVLPLFQRVVAHEPITTKVKFNKEVIRILQRSCLGCHKPDGIAGISLATYDEARPWAKAMKEEMLERRMPPWHAVKGFGEFRNGPELTQREIDFVVNWVEGGAPPGDEKDLPRGALFSDDWQLGKPDLVVDTSGEVEVAPDDDVVRTFLLPIDLKRDRWIKAIDLKPENPAVVHCASFGIAIAGESEMLKTAAADDKGGQDSLGRPDLPVAPLWSWMPGQKTVALPDGVGRLLPAGSAVVVRIHYHGSSDTVKDRSSVGLYFDAAAPKRKLRAYDISDGNAVISAADHTFRVKASVVIGADEQAVGVTPLANPLLVSLQATAVRPDGREDVLIWTRGYKADWQPTYFFKKPRNLPAGTRVEIVAYFDNSEDNQNNPNSPPKAVRLADLSASPLCRLLVATARGTD